MNGPRREIELRLTDGRLLTIRIINEQIQINVDAVTILLIERADAWELAEALDALASGA